MGYLLIGILLAVLILPFVWKMVEENLEVFLFIMGVLAALSSGQNFIALLHIILEPMNYFTTATVLILGLLFKVCNVKIKQVIQKCMRMIPERLFLFLVITVLGLMSAIITSIVAAILMVEIVHALPYNHKDKTLLTVIACFAIGVGCMLTPLGGPLPTVIVGTLGKNFGYLLPIFAMYVVPCVLLLGIFGSFFISYRHRKIQSADATDRQLQEENIAVRKIESFPEVFLRALYVFVFIVGVELLGAGFKPLVAGVIPNLSNPLLYLGNTLSAVLDNATMAAAEFYKGMPHAQIVAAGLGLCIAGGILIPGNVSNVICASALGIKPKEWAMAGLPIGVALLGVFLVTIL